MSRGNAAARKPETVSQPVDPTRASDAAGEVLRQTDKLLARLAQASGSLAALRALYADVCDGDRELHPLSAGAMGDCLWAVDELLDQAIESAKALDALRSESAR